MSEWGRGTPVREWVIEIDERCTGCGMCIATCPERALLVDRGRPRFVVQRCTGCLACAEICPVGAIREVTR